MILTTSTILLVQCLLYNLVSSVSQHPILIIVSYDAFRHDFISPENTPQLERLKYAGTYADYLLNIFPTKTFPNHHTIATGMFSETHGVVANQYFNRTTQKAVRMSYEMFHYNEDIVPVWRLNEDAGDGRHSGVMMWPGSNYPYQGKNATHVKEWDPKMDWYERLDIVISWLTDPVKPANLVLIYFEEPDTHAHAYGPNSEKVVSIIKKLDNVTHYLEEQLKLKGLADKANVVHLSDHGLTAVTPPRFINITQYLDPNTYNKVGTSPCFQIFPKEGYEDDIYKKLKNASLHNNFTVYRKEEFPTRWHFGNNERSPPIFVMADVGYALDDLIIAAPKYAEHYGFNLTNTSEFGVHGYDYLVEEMHPIFLARGPNFKKNHKVEPFSTVNLFNIFCRILNITPTPNNGTVTSFSDILTNDGSKFHGFASILSITVLSILVVFILVGCSALIIFVTIKHRQRITTTAALKKRFPQTGHTCFETQTLLESDDTTSPPCI